MYGFLQKLKCCQTNPHNPIPKHTNHVRTRNNVKVQGGGGFAKKVGSGNIYDEIQIQSLCDHSTVPAIKRIGMLSNLFITLDTNALNRNDQKNTQANEIM